MERFGFLGRRSTDFPLQRGDESRMVLPDAVAVALGVAGGHGDAGRRFVDRIRDEQTCGQTLSAHGVAGCQRTFCHVQRGPSAFVAPLHAFGSEPMVELRVDPVELFEQFARPVADQRRQRCCIQAAGERADAIEIAAQAVRPSAHLHPVDLDQWAVRCTDRPHLVKGLTQAGPCLLFAAVAPQQAGQALARHRLGVREDQVREQRPGLATAGRRVRSVRRREAESAEQPGLAGLRHLAVAPPKSRSM